MHHDADLILEETKSLCNFFVMDLLYNLNFDKMIARAQRAELIETAFASARGDLIGIRARELSLFLHVLTIAFGGDAALHRPFRAIQ